MKRILTICCCSAVLTISLCAPAYAQSWVMEASGGWSTPVSDIGSTLSTGWSADFSAGHQFSGWFSLLGELSYSAMPVKQSVLLQYQAPHGNGQILTLGIDPELRFPVSSNLRGFVTGGVDLVHRNVKLTSASLETVDTSVGLQQVSTLNVLSSESATGIGENVGVGMAYPIKAINAEVFVHVRYFRVSTAAVTAMVPVMFGIRWTGR